MVLALHWDYCCCFCFSAGAADFRFEAIRGALKELSAPSNRAEKVLLSLSDPTTEPIPAAATKAACGAYPGK